MKTFEVTLGIILIVAFLALRLWRPFMYLFQEKDRTRTVVVTVLGLAMLFGGGLMIWLSSR